MTNSISFFESKLSFDSKNKPFEKEEEKKLFKVLSLIRKEI